MIVDEPTLTVLLRNITHFVVLVAAYSFLLWLAAEITGSGFPQPWRTRSKLAVAYIFGPLGGLAMYGVGWLPLPDAQFPWQWIMAALTGLACTIAAERIVNDTLIGRFVHFWNRNEAREDK